MSVTFPHVAGRGSVWARWRTFVCGMLVWLWTTAFAAADAFQWLDGTSGGFADHNRWRDQQNQSFDPPDPNPLDRYPGPSDIVAFPQDMGEYSVTIFDASVRGTSIADTTAGSLITLFVNGTYRAGETYVINTLFSGAGTLIAEPALLYDTVLSGVQANFTRLTVDTSSPLPVRTGMVVRNQANVTSQGSLVLDAGVTLDNGTWTHTGILPGAAVDVLNGGRLIVREINAADPPSEANLLVSSGATVDMDHIEGRVDATTAASVTLKRASLFSAPAFLNPAVFRDGGTMLTVLDRLHVAGGPLQFKSGGRLRTVNLSHEQGAFSTEAIDSGSAIDVTGLLDSGHVFARNGATASVATALNATLNADGAGSQVTFNSLASASPQSGGFQAMAGGVLSGGIVSLGTGSGQVRGTSSRLELEGPLIAGRGGAVALTAADGGRIDCEEVVLGETASGDGQATVTGSNSLLFVRNDMVIGDASGARGTLAIENLGRVQVGLPTPGALGIAIGYVPGSDGQVAVRSGGVLDTRTAGLAGVGAGVGGAGTINILSGGRTLAHSLTAGVFPAGDGLITCSGAGSSIEVDDKLSIGQLGRGRLNILNQGIVTAKEIVAGDALLDNQINVRLGGTLRYNKMLSVGHDGSATMRVTEGGRVQGAPFARLSIAGNSASSAGTLVIDGVGSSVLFPKGGSMIVGEEGHGTLTVSGGGLLELEGVGIGGTETSTGTATVTGPGSRWTISYTLRVGLGQGTPASLTVADSGYVRVGEVMGSLSDEGVTLASGGRLNVGAGDALPGTLRVGAGGRLLLLGRGVVGGKVIQALGGYIEVGQSPGIGRIESDFEQEAGADLEMEIAGLTAGALYDRLEVTGTAQLNGKLTVAFINGFAPRAGQSFELLTAGSITGNFTEVLLTGLQPGFQHGLTIAGNRVQLTALNDGVATTTPAEPVISFETFGYRIMLSRPALLEGWNWQTSTGIAPGTWTTMANAGHVIPLISNPNEGRRFYRLARP